MKLGKNVKVCFAGKTFRGEVPDRIATALGLQSDPLDRLQKEFDSAFDVAEKSNLANAKRQSDKGNARLIARQKVEAEAKQILAESKQPKEVQPQSDKPQKGKKK